MSHGVKEVRNKLNAVAENHHTFGFKLDSQPILRRREETCSYVYADGIIGRDNDKAKIVNMFLNPNVYRDVSFISIVGIGGLGKTALPQLVYNDERIIKHFPSMIWTCVADEDPKHLNVKAVLAKILESITKKRQNDSSLDVLQCKVREHLAESNYLLVLDDLWNEDRNEWLALENFLKGSPSGSWCLVTTRSRSTASIVGGGSLYELQGLSKEDSMHLFKEVAFGKERGQENPQDLVQIGQTIVEKCANVPLAISVAGSLLYGQSKEKWLSFANNGFSAINAENDGILPMLKFSYHTLDFPLKSCFCYCSLFPKDFEIMKETLISLWMAQGYVIPLMGEQNIEDIAEEYFTILLRRCFFQDVKKDEFGEIVSFKLHDLMHDMAQEVVKKEICMVDSLTSDLDKKICHISIAKCTSVEGSWTKHRIRTLYLLNKSMMGISSLCMVLKNWMSLRALNLRNSGIDALPDEIGKLIHLRYLDLSYNGQMELLPRSFTKLYNLQTLNLKCCSSLIELPQEIGKLVKLVCLDTEDCSKLTHMPASMGKLSRLHKLTRFAVDFSNPNSGDVLNGIKVLTKIKGCVEVSIYGFEDATLDQKEKYKRGGYFMNKVDIKNIVFSFMRKFRGEEYEEAIMEGMRPNQRLQRLVLKWYEGERMPSWGRGDNMASSLPNLVEIKLYSCKGIKYLPGIGQLRYLRSLTLNDLPSLEYMEDNVNNNDVGAGLVMASDRVVFFPSMEVLELGWLNKLKGWYRYEEVSNSQLSCQLTCCFPSLLKLYIKECPELISIPGIPNVEYVELKYVNEK